MALPNPRTNSVRIVGGGTQHDAASALFGHEYEQFQWPTAEADDQPDYPAANTIAEQNVVITDGRIPEVLDYLVTLLSPLGEVLAMIAETIGDAGALHITVFADPVSEKTRETIYGGERELLDRFPDITFDFHLRQPERVDGEPMIPPAPQALVLWHRVDTDAHGG